MTPAKPTPEWTAKRLFELSIGVYFSGGVVTSLVSLLVPRLKLLIGLDYQQALLVQLAFYSSYLLFAAPITAALVAIGYMRGIAAGLAIMAVAALGLAGAVTGGSYPAALLSLLLLSAGITFLQIAGNVVIAVVEPAGRATARITLLQGFNSIGTVLGPLLGAQFLLATPAASEGLRLGLPFVAVAGLAGVLAIAFALHRGMLGAEHRPTRVPLLPLQRGVLADRTLVFGTIAMFCYVGAEVTIGTLLTSYLVRGDILALDPVRAGQMVSLYWGGAMLGRFAGAFLLGRVAAPRMLLCVAIGAVVLTCTAVLGDGPVGAVALIAVGLCNAIMYPTIFALALPAQASAAPYASMLLCMAVVGGSIIPMATGVLADASALAPALLLPAACYAVIAAFARHRGALSRTPSA